MRVPPRASSTPAGGWCCPASRTTTPISCKAAPQLGQLDLKDAASHEEFGRRIAEYAKSKAPGEWITGGNWDHDKFPGGELPTAALIDRYCADRPVFVSRFDGHMAVANGMALRLGGITATTDDPVGGTIVRRRGAREPAGVLKDAAMSPWRGRYRRGLPRSWPRTRARPSARRAAWASPPSTTSPRASRTCEPTRASAPKAA